MCGDCAKDSTEQKKDKHHNKLSEQVEKLTAEKDEVFAQLQRVSADYINYQKRSAKQIFESIAYEKEAIIKSLLPVLDNFEHSLCGAENLQDAESLRKAVKIIYGQMLSILKNHGIEQIGSVGQKFDPACHEAVMNRSEPDKDEFIVLEEFQKGYRIGEKVLRPGRVIVNKLPPQTQDIPKQQNDAGNQTQADSLEDGD